MTHLFEKIDFLFYAAYAKSICILLFLVCFIVARRLFAAMQFSGPKDTYSKFRLVLWPFTSQFGLSFRNANEDRVRKFRFFIACLFLISLVYICLRVGAAILASSIQNDIDAIKRTGLTN